MNISSLRLYKLFIVVKSLYVAYLHQVYILCLLKTTRLNINLRHKQNVKIYSFMSLNN